jgi:hypothetical protein
VNMFVSIRSQAQNFDTKDTGVVVCGDELVTVRSSPPALGATP